MKKPACVKDQLLSWGQHLELELPNAYEDTQTFYSPRRIARSVLNTRPLFRTILSHKKYEIKSFLHT